MEAIQPPIILSSCCRSSSPANGSLTVSPMDSRPPGLLPELIQPPGCAASAASKLAWRLGRPAGRCWLARSTGATPLHASRSHIVYSRRRDQGHGAVRATHMDALFSKAMLVVRRSDIHIHEGHKILVADPAGAAAAPVVHKDVSI
ncbi:hypothetical protein L1887_38757 [Cichorium endivia]|nr:hypothetical protein L1887_38757 [Cichorium endivia]